MKSSTFSGGARYRPGRTSSKPRLEALEDRCLLSITEFALPNGDRQPTGIVTGPDGNLWFTEDYFNPKVAVMTPAGVIAAEFPIGPFGTVVSNEIANGSDGNLWFITYTGNGYNAYIDRITPTGTITEFPIPGNGGAPQDITTGPDGNVWFTQYYTDQIGYVTPAGSITQFNIPAGNGHPYYITAAPDGNLWFTQPDGNKIGQITPAGVITEFALPAASYPDGITAGPDGNLWFTAGADVSTGSQSESAIGRITTSGVVTEYSVPTALSRPLGITSGPDGNLWFTELSGNNIGMITPAGSITEYPIPTSGSQPFNITTGPDGNLWFTEFNANKIARLAFPVPAHISLNFNSLPSAQGWTYVSGYPPNSPVETNAYSVDGTKLSQNVQTTTAGPVYAAYEMYNVIDPLVPFTIEARARVTQSTQFDPSTTGVTLMLGGYTGNEGFIVGLDTNNINILGTGPLIPFDNTQFHDYRIEATPGVSIKLFIDNALVADRVPYSVSEPNVLQLGNDSSFENGQAELTSYSFAQGPTLAPIPDQTVNEGSLLSVRVSATDPNPAAVLTYSLKSAPPGATIDPNTGVFTYTPTEGPATYPVTVRVTDNGALPLSDTTSFNIIVNDVPPTASISAPLDGFQGVSGQARGFTLGATDPSPVDQAAGFTYAVTWGDGQSNQYAGPDGTAASHVYATPGNYTVSVTATDMDGLTSPVATENLTILATEQQGAELAVGGKPGYDAFVLTAGPGIGEFQVKLNGQTLGLFPATGGVHVYGESAINTVTVNGTTSGDQFTIDQADIVLNGTMIGGDNIERWIANGLAGGDTFTFGGNSMGAAATIEAKGGNNTLYAPTLGSNQSNTWTINGTNSGTLNGPDWTFSGIQNLVGGANDDLFQFVGAGRVTGNVNGNGAFSAAGNTLDYTGYTGASTVTVNLANGKATAIGGSFSNIETALGQTSTASDTLIGANTTNAWAISGANSGTVNSFNFLGFGNLTGGAGADTFTVGSNGSLTGRLDGGSGRNMIVGPNLADTFNITANNAGNLNTSVIPSFIRIQNLTGGGQPTSFVFGAGMSVTGNINGGTGGGTLNYQNYSTNVSVNLQTSRATGVGGAAINLVGVTGGSGNNTLRGANTASTWNITANNAGNINGAFTFTGFANLKGGTGTNDFVFSDQQGVTGTIDGGGGSNRLDYSAYSTGLYVNLRTGVATGTGGIENFKQVFGGNGNDILVGMGSGILLEEGTGNDLIIGGSGQATIQSGSGQDIVIAGSTTYDNNQAALQAIEDYWSTNGGTFAQRVAGLSSGITGGYQLNSSTVKHHGGSGDTIALGSANDWLFWRMVGSGKDTLTGTPGQSTLI